MFESKDLADLISKLESLEDEELGVRLLSEFTSKSRIHGQLLINKDEGLDHEEWKMKCDKAKSELDEVIQRIKNL